MLPGWEVTAATPQSSFRDGGEIVGFDRGRIRLHVKTSCFALEGRRTGLDYVADAPAPPGTVFQIRQKFPLDLEVNLPLFPAPKDRAKHAAVFGWRASAARTWPPCAGPPRFHV
jgi:hypothetical protein